MKKLLGVMCLWAIASVAVAQVGAIGLGAMAGSGSGSIAVLRLVANTPQTAPIVMTGDVTASNAGSASVSLPSANVIVPTGTASLAPSAVSDSVTTLNATLDLPVGTTGNAGAAGGGSSYAAGGAFVYRATSGTLPSLPSLLPTPPVIITPLPVL